MPKMKYYELSDEEIKEYLGEFYDMVSMLKSREEARAFFKDLLTRSEIVMVSRRLQIAKMLLQGATYIDIIEKLKVGSTTINYVEKWLRSGFGGYEKIVAEYNKIKEQKRLKTNDIIEPNSFKELRRKYPAHFWIFNLLLDR